MPPDAEPGAIASPWWQRGVVYQIYPRSFQDANADGLGDLPGIVARLEYLQELGVDAIWLSPIYPSPMADFGYDVADYTGIDPIFGTLADFDRLVEAAHARGLKVILDFVPNHSSSEHPWFREARRSRASARRDWYIWRDPASGGGVPNNWLSVFGGSAWELDEATGQYYYHAFLKEQPDLNWRNPAVVQAMANVLEFWLQRGVDGFRVDVIWHLIKDEQLRDNPINPGFKDGMSPYDRLLPVYTSDRPEVHGVIAGMRAVLDRYDDRVLIGEIYLPIERLVDYYGRDLTGAHLPFNFQLILSAWDAATIARLITDYEAALPPGGWPNWVLGNHDNHRIASRIGAAQARVAACLLLTLRGTPTLYYGDEIGMHDVPIPDHRVQDPVERRIPGIGLGRDPERTPMQWSGAPAGGFTTADPWLPLADDVGLVNVEAQQSDPRSMLAWHRALIALRKSEPALAVGEINHVEAIGTSLFYTRSFEGRRLFVALNLGHSPVDVPVTPGAGGVVLIASGRIRNGERVDGHVALQGDEALVMALDPA